MNLALAGLYLAAFMSVLDGAIVYMGLPAMERDLRIGIADQQWVVGIYTLFQGSFTLAAGTLGDLLGRRRVFLIGTILFTLGSITCGFAVSGGMLIVARAAQGIGGSVLFSLTIAMAVALSDATSKERVMRGFANVAGIGCIIAPLIGGVLIATLGWRSIFFVNVPVAAFAIWAVTRSVPESALQRGRRLDAPGQLLAITGLFALSYGLIEGNTLGWVSLPILGAFALAVVAIAFFVRGELRASEPMLRLAYLRDGVFAGSALSIFMNGAEYFGVFLVTSLFVQNVQGVSPLATGFYLTPALLLFFIVNQTSGAITSRIGVPRTMVLGNALEALGLLLYLPLQVHSPTVAVSLAFALWSIGAALTYTPTMTVGMGRIPTQDAGMGSGILSMANALGGVVGIGIIGSLLSAASAANLAVAFRAHAIPPRVGHAILTAAQHGGAWAAIASDDVGTTSRRVLLQLANAAFVDGMHVALGVAGLAGLVLTVAIAAAVLRRQRAGAAAAEAG